MSCRLLYRIDPRQNMAHRCRRGASTPSLTNMARYYRVEILADHVGGDPSRIWQMTWKRPFVCAAARLVP